MATVFHKTIPKKNLEELNLKLLQKVKAKVKPDALVVHQSKDEMKMQRWKVGRDSFTVNWNHNPNKIGFYRCKSL